MNPDDIARMIEEKIRAHIHNGIQATRNQLYDIFGHIQTVSAAPVDAPSTIYDQFQIYNNLLYWYDFGDNSWHNSGATGGAAAPDTSIQFNDGGNFAGSADFTFNSSNDTVTLGASNGEGTLTGATGAPGETGGALNIFAGSGGVSGGGSGGNINMFAGSARSDAGIGGSIVMQGGGGVGDGSTGGDISLLAGNNGTGTDPATPGEIIITAGDSSTPISPGGRVLITSGDHTDSGEGGGILIHSGQGNSGGPGGIIEIATGSSGGGNANGSSIGIESTSPSGSGIGGDLFLNGVVLSTTAKGKFIVIPSCAGTPTGTPNGNIRMVYDSSNNKLYVYNGAWKSVTLT